MCHAKIYIIVVRSERHTCIMIVIKEKVITHKLQDIVVCPHNLTASKINKIRLNDV